jgi:hypothetical protein
VDKLESDEYAVHSLGVELDEDFSDVHGEGQTKDGNEGSNNIAETMVDVYCVDVELLNLREGIWYLGVRVGIALQVRAFVFKYYVNNDGIGEHDEVEDTLPYVELALIIGLRILVLCQYVDGLENFNFLNGKPDELLLLVILCVYSIAHLFQRVEERCEFLVS